MIPKTIPHETNRTVAFMPAATQNQNLQIIEDYDIAADDKRRISLRNAKTKYFHVKAFANGCYLLEPRVLVPPQKISSRSLAMLEKSVANLKKSKVSEPIDLSRFAKK